METCSRSSRRSPRERPLERCDALEIDSRGGVSLATRFGSSLMCFTRLAMRFRIGFAQVRPRRFGSCISTWPLGLPVVKIAGDCRRSGITLPQTPAAVIRSSVLGVEARRDSKSAIPRGVCSYFPPRVAVGIFLTPFPSWIRVGLIPTRASLLESQDGTLGFH
jgi:hypothetical protein